MSQLGAVEPVRCCRDSEVSELGAVEPVGCCRASEVQ